MHLSVRQLGPRRFASPAGQRMAGLAPPQGSSHAGHHPSILAPRAEGEQHHHATAPARVGGVGREDVPHRQPGGTLLQPAAVAGPRWRPSRRHAPGGDAHLLLRG
eukprot:scaffold2504_cov405-Prasinococcus_capsulatus_cf.AAC.1